jgi:hypothetical protein
MQYDWTPIFCGSAFLVIALTIIAFIVIQEKARRKQEEPLTPEQATAVLRQGNVLGCSIFVVWILGAIFWGIGQILPAIKDQLPLIFQPIFFILAVGVGIYLAVSAIKDQISGLHRRGYGKYMKGQAAVTWGIGVLMVIAVILYVAWIKITGH